MDWRAKNFYGTIWMTDFNIFSSVKMKFDLIVLEAINLNKAYNYVEAINESNLVDLFFFEVVKNGAICQFLF